MPFPWALAAYGIAAAAMYRRHGGYSWGSQQPAYPAVQLEDADNGGAFALPVGTEIDLPAPAGGGVWQCQYDPQLLQELGPGRYLTVGAGQTALVCQSRPSSVPGSMTPMFIQGYQVQLVIQPATQQPGLQQSRGYNQTTAVLRVYDPLTNSILANDVGPGAAAFSGSDNPALQPLTAVPATSGSDGLGGCPGCG